MLHDTFFKKDKVMMNWQLKIDIFMSLEMISQRLFPRGTSALCKFSHGFMTKLYIDNIENPISVFLV